MRFINLDNQIVYTGPQAQTPSFRRRQWPKKNFKCSLSHTKPTYDGCYSSPSIPACAGNVSASALTPASAEPMEIPASTKLVFEKRDLLQDSWIPPGGVSFPDIEIGIPRVCFTAIETDGGTRVELRLQSNSLIQLPNVNGQKQRGEILESQLASSENAVHIFPGHPNTEAIAYEASSRSNCRSQDTEYHGCMSVGGTGSIASNERDHAQNHLGSISEQNGIPAKPKVLDDTLESQSAMWLTNSQTLVGSSKGLSRLGDKDSPEVWNLDGLDREAEDTDCTDASDCNVTAQCAAASSPFGNTDAHSYVHSYVTKCLGHQEVATGCGSPEALGQDGQPANANEHGELNSCLVRHHLDNVEVAAGSNKNQCPRKRRKADLLLSTPGPDTISSVTTLANLEGGRGPLTRSRATALTKLYLNATRKRPALFTGRRRAPTEAGGPRAFVGGN